MGSKERWPGGYVHRQKDGRSLFVIEREVSGRRFHVSTRAHSLRAAMKHLERFETDPVGYRPEGLEADEPLHLDEKLTEPFYDWMTNIRGTTKKHAHAVNNRLADWAEDLKGRDLRRLSLRDDIRPALDRRVTCRAHRISTLKAFFSWLRKERALLTSGQDATLDITVPQSVPEKHKRRKAVPFSFVQIAADRLDPEYRDLLTLMAATGWHFTELERFVRRPESQIVSALRGETLAVLVTLHKGGEMTRTPVVDRDVLAAAKRIRERGSIPKRPNLALRVACEEAKKAGEEIEVFTFGVLRHSVATWAIEGGALPAAVAEFLVHRDARTTRRFYADVSVPTTSVPLPKLRLVKKT